jgi:LysM repeat protein
MTLVAVMISACEQPYSTQPVVTNTPIDTNSLFATPIETDTELSDVERFATQTAQVANPGGVVTSTPVGVGVTPQNPTATQTPIISLPNNPTATFTATQAVPGGGPTSTFVPSGSRPLTYTLQSQEFPFCIARRFNVDPQELLDASRLGSPDIYYAGLVLTIPQDPTKIWPVQLWGPRALRTHPAPYVVTGNADTTIHGVACKFGDADPALIAQQNGLSQSAVLTVGQSLSVP